MVENSMKRLCDGLDRFAFLPLGCLCVRLVGVLVLSAAGAG
jgi:hypothetical protein